MLALARAPSMPSKVRSLAVAALTVSALAAETAPLRDDRARGALLGALVADSLALSTHYEYDAVKIKKFYGAIDRYYAPGEKTGGETHGIGWGARNFHNGNGHPEGAKRAGENTDYGDYTLLVAEHLAAASAAAAGAPPSRFDVESFVPRWSSAMQTWRSWICTMTKTTYKQVWWWVIRGRFAAAIREHGVNPAARAAWHRFATRVRSLLTGRRRPPRLLSAGAARYAGREARRRLERDELPLRRGRRCLRERGASEGVCPSIARDFPSATVEDRTLIAVERRFRSYQDRTRTTLASPLNRATFALPPRRLPRERNFRGRRGALRARVHVHAPRADGARRRRVFCARHAPGRAHRRDAARRDRGDRRRAVVGRVRACARGWRRRLGA